MGKMAVLIVDVQKALVEANIHTGRGVCGTEESGDEAEGSELKLSMSDTTAAGGETSWRAERKAGRFNRRWNRKRENGILIRASTVRSRRPIWRVFSENRLPTDSHGYADGILHRCHL